MNRQTKPIYEFGPFRLDGARHLLLRDGQPVPLTTKALDTLLALVEHDGHLVEKDKLMRQVWPDTVVEEGNLAVTISMLRKALGESPNEHRYIETVPRRGYRFVASMRAVGGEGVEFTEQEQGASGTPLWEDEMGEPARKRVIIARGLMWPTAIVVALAVGGVLWFSFFRTNPRFSLPPIKSIPLTSFLGREEWPAFSPDGKQLAFSWNGEKEDNFDIYVKLVDAGTPLRLTNHPGIDSSPTWSPDGRYIAFSRFDKGEEGIFMVPALGGPERKLLSFDTEWFVRDPAIVVWSPDGKYLAFTDRPFIQGGNNILLLSLENLETRRLMAPPAQSQGDWHPAFSPDGETLAFTRWTRYGVCDIYVVPIRGGEPKRLTFDDQPVGGLAWTADGQSIVFLSSRGDASSRLWKISAAGGTPEPLALGSNPTWIGMQFSISRQGNRLAYSIAFSDKNIWRMKVPSSKGHSASPVKLISSSLDDWDAQFSPDGKRIAFESVRSGTLQVWVCEADGSNPIQLTYIGESFSGHAYGSGSPSWSPDGRQVAFDAAVEVNNDDIRHIHVVNAEGGPPRCITTGSSYDGMPSWSRDGRWIYFASNRSGAWQVWKVPVEGGEAVQLTKNGGFRAFDSPDGKFVYYSKQDSSGLWRIAAEGGEESLILDQLQKGYFHAWAVADRGIYFIHPEPKPPAAIEFFSFAKGRVTRIASLDKESYQWSSTLSISPDEKWILYTQRDQSGSDIMLVENFR
ncbi:MAG TPA: winged helix-turn-helix domain-containing protein [Blastocatellia bacterium]|nr:winged helix-turn-helix domain-containing protein [Blastocatellia bacterium]